MSQGQAGLTVLTALAPLPLWIWSRPPARRLPYPLGEIRCRLFARARHGLWHGVRALGLQPGDEVLVPAYHHGSEIEALVRAGLACRFYDATESLKPDESELERLLTPRTRALHLTHFLGFPQDAARWRAWCDARGLLLIEDAAQAWLARRGHRPVGSDADLAIYCLYKSFGVPDGAALLVRARPPTVKHRRRIGLAGLGFEHALWLAGRSPLLARVALFAYRRRDYVTEQDFALGDPASAPSVATLLALPRVAHHGAVHQRRWNYRQLLSELGDLVPPAFRPLPPGASPFVFPIETDDKPGLLERLRARGIRALDLWAVPHPALPNGFRCAAALRARVVGLPVHQELRPNDLERIVDGVREVARAPSVALRTAQDHVHQGGVDP